MRKRILMSFTVFLFGVSIFGLLFTRQIPLSTSSDLVRHESRPPYDLYDPVHYGLPPTIAGYKTFAVLTSDNTLCLSPGEKRLVLQATQSNVQGFLSESNYAAIQQDLQRQGLSAFSRDNIQIVGPGTTFDQFVNENEMWNEARKKSGCITSGPPGKVAESLTSATPTIIAEAWSILRATIPADIPVYIPTYMPTRFSPPQLEELQSDKELGWIYTITYEAQTNDDHELIAFILGGGKGALGNWPGGPGTNESISVDGVNGQLQVISSKDLTNTIPPTTYLRVFWLNQGRSYQIKAISPLMTEDEIKQILESLVRI